MKFNAIKYGLLGCIAGVPAFVLCALAAYSKHYVDPANPMLILFIKIFAEPLNKVYLLFFRAQAPTGPSMTAAPLLPLFEHEAVLVFYATGILLSMLALYFSLKAVKAKENTFWYTNSAFWGIYALFMFNLYLGVGALVLAVAAIFNMRDREKH